MFKNGQRYKGLKIEFDYEGLHAIGVIERRNIYSSDTFVVRVTKIINYSDGDSCLHDCDGYFSEDVGWNVMQNYIKRVFYENKPVLAEDGEYYI